MFILELECIIAEQIIEICFLVKKLTLKIEANE
jgi:hypothetical protein